MATTTRVKHTKLDHVTINQGLTIVHPNLDQSRKSHSDDITVDIVAVPGLGANPEFTWTRNKVDWLRDSNMLPRSVTNARIMVFEYESQWFGRGSINQRLSSVADQLVQALSHRRPRGSKRPVIFVCHCLGGIVVEKAILGAQLRQNDYPNLFTSIVGCVFLGTPFRGTKSQSKAAALAEMASTIGLGVNSGLLKLLEDGSETLRDLLADFSGLARETNMQLFCFFEQHASDIAKLVFKGPHIKTKELIVEEDSAHIDGYRTGGLASDHFGLNKFDGPKDGAYISVAGEVNAMVQKANGILKSRANTTRQILVDDATFQTILDDLKATDQQKDMQDSLRSRPESQASWVLTNEHYVNWHEGKTKDPRVLWIHGNAGKGQPVVASSIVHHLEEQAKAKEGVFLAYFFCDEKDSHRRSIRDILKLLMRQMIWKSRNLTEHLLIDEGKGKKGGRKSLNFDTVPLAALWRSLQSMLNDSSVESVYFLINAFDETDGETRKEFLELLEPYLEAGEEMSSEDTMVKWVFLSRSGRPDIEKSLTKGLVICMEDKENAGFVNDEVKREISRQVDELATEHSFNDALTYLVKRYIYAKAEGNYIYAHLVVQELRNLEPPQRNISIIRKFLEDLPYGLTDIFQFIRRRVLNPQSEGIEYTKEILRCLTLTMESPTLLEVGLIADLPPVVRNDDSTLHSFIRRCGAFLTIITDEDGDEKVEWIDVSAKEYLKTYAKEELSLDLIDVQHGIIALRCLEYVRNHFAITPANPEEDDSRSLAPQEGQDDSDHEGDDENEENDNASQTDENPTVDAVASPQNEDPPPVDDAEDFEEQGEEHSPPLLDYAVLYWVEHAMEAPSDMVEELDLNSEFWSEESPARGAWWLEYSKETRFAGVTGITASHLAALKGFPALLQHLLDSKKTEELSKADSWGYTPLAWACDNGDVSLVDRLLKAGIDVNMVSVADSPSALWAAAVCGNTEIVQYLIERGAEVNWQSEGRGTPLYIAASNSHLETVRLLLQHGADVNLKGNVHIRPLNIAAYTGSLDIAQLLLEQGADIDPDDDYRYGSALGAAARKGYVDIVRLLLQKGWDANRKIQTYNSPLVAAATYGHAEVVEILLEHQIEGASKIQALDIASKKGRADVVRHLLEQTPYLPHQKAFHNAAMYGRDEVLELLEKRGTNPEMLSTAIYHASDQERESTVNLLLKFGADPNAEGAEYGNALQAAAFDGSTGIVESLLAHKADVNSVGGTYGTALQAAAVYGHQDIIKLLLDHGALVNTENVGRYGSALQAACWFNDDDVVTLLIDHGADVNAAGGMYGFPIIAATDEAMQINVGILVDRGADVNVRDIRDEKAPLLVLAGFTLGKETLELLLDHGADIESADDDGTTVLISVADSNDKESLEMLLGRGANIHAVSKTLGTALSAAASEGDEESLRVLLDHGGDANQACGNWGTALQAASHAADLDCINMLLEAGADINACTDVGYGSALAAASFAGDVACVQRLLDAGAEVNAAAGEDGSPLQAAATANRPECLQVLLEHSADVNLGGGPSYSCPLQAAAANPDAFEIVKTLLDHGATIDVPGGMYGSLMQAAAVGGNLDTLNLLLEHGTDVHAVGGKYGTALQAAALKAGTDFVRRLLDQNLDANVVAGKYSTALQAAAFAKNAEVTTLLLEHQANPQHEGGFYGNALNAATTGSNIDALKVLLDQALPYEMLDEALLQAVYRRNYDAVELLLKKGASVEASDYQLGSAFELLKKDAAVDNNSDDGHGDDDDEDEESVTSDEDSEEESSDGISEDNDAASENEGTDNDASVADLQLEDPSTADSKIQKYLEEARQKLRSNPALRRSAAVKRKPVAQNQTNGELPSATDQYDALGVSKPQHVEAADNTYQASGDRWRTESQSTYPSYAAFNQVQPAAAPTTEYRPYTNPVQDTQAYSPYQHQNQSQPYTSSYSNQQAAPAPVHSNYQAYNQNMVPPASYQQQQQQHLQQYPAQQAYPPQQPYPPQQGYPSQHPYTSPQPYSSQQAYQTQPAPQTQQPYHDQQPYPSQQYSCYNPSYTPPPVNPNQSTDPLNFDRLQQRAQVFGAQLGKFWK